MPPGLKAFLQRWIITTLAVLVAEHFVSGIHYDHWRALLIATLVLGILNAILRPLLIFATVGIMGALNFLAGLRVALVTLPLQIALFGFFLLAINAALLLMVGKFVPAFHVDDFWAAFWGGVVIGVVTMILNSFTRTGDARVIFRRGPDRPPTDKTGGGSGPVIDI
jgi:putative membrane protein